MRPRGLPFRSRAATWALVGIAPAAILSAVAGGMPAHAVIVDAWSAAQNISAAGWAGSFPEIAASADGTKATAVWHRYNGSNYMAQAASATISGRTATWSAPINISTPGGHAYEPKIALSTDGTRATAVWHRSTTGGAVVQAASATISGDTATWSAPTDLSASGQQAEDPEIALSTDGTRATAVWHRWEGSNQVIQSASATVSGNSATWGSATDLSAIAYGAYRPRIGISADGTQAVAAWYIGSGMADETVQAASATVSGTTAAWGTVTDLSDPGQDASLPDIAVSADGLQATAVWGRWNGSNNLIQAASATVAGPVATWGTVSNLSATGQDSDGATIHAAADGTRAIASWHRWDGGSFTYSTATAAISGTLGTWAPAQTASVTGPTATYLRTAISADGTQVTAIWCESDGSNQVVHSASATVSASGANWGTVSRFSATGQNASLPVLAPSADGTKATAVWLRSNGTDEIVQAASGLFEAPAITSGNAAAATSGAAMTNVTVTGTGTPAPALSASGALPSGVTFTDNSDGTATITGVPASAGTYPLTITAANGINASATQAFTLTVSAAPETAKSAQAPSNGCVRAPRTLPKAGTVPLTKTGCRTNAGQWVGAIATSTARAARGKARSPRVSLTCVGAGKKAPAAIPTGYGDGSKHCPRGAVALKKTAGKGTVTITWVAPANATHDAYRLSRAYTSR